MSPRLFSRSHGPNRRHFPTRAFGIGAGAALVGAMVLGAATSSAQSAALLAPPAKADEPVIVAEVAPAAPTALAGFAPPAPKPVSTQATAAQFRINADLPSGPLGIPGVVLQAYKLAADRVGTESPQCKLPWFLLAGIGRIESNHASNGSVDQFGTTINPINGPVLDGSLAGNEVITDGRGGHVSAMGPMQFIPSTWAAWGSDANGDGKADPNNIFDSTYSAGRYLCAGVSDIMSDGTKVNAVLRYNHSMEYVANVLSWAGAYATGVMPTNPIPEPKRPPSSSSKKPSTSAKPGEPSTSGAPSESTTTTTKKPTPTQQCLAPGICLPPGVTIPGQPAPAPTKQPTKKAPAATTPAR